MRTITNCKGSPNSRATSGLQRSDIPSPDDSRWIVGQPEVIQKRACGKCERGSGRVVGQPEVEKVGVPPVRHLEIVTVLGPCLDWFCRICCLPDMSLVPAGHVVTQPEIRFVNSVVQKHLVSTFRADWLLFQAVLSFLIGDCASRGATQPIYGLRDDA